MPISERTVEIDKEITFKYTKLAVKTFKCYWYYWIIQDLEATCMYKKLLTYSMESHATSHIVECLDVVHYDELCSKNDIFTKAKLFCKPINSEHVKTTCCTGPQTWLIACICLSSNDVTDVWIHKKCKVGETPSFMSVKSFKWQKQKKITTFTNSKKIIQYMSELKSLFPQAGNASTFCLFPCFSLFLKSFIYFFFFFTKAAEWGVGVRAGTGCWLLLQPACVTSLDCKDEESSGNSASVYWAAAPLNPPERCRLP